MDFCENILRKLFFFLSLVLEAHCALGMEDGDAKYNVVERILDGTEEPTDLPFQILESITENFSEERKIGVGGFGEVFKVKFVL